MTQTAVNPHPAGTASDHARAEGELTRPEELRPGQRMRTQGRTITEADLVGFAALTGDRHPVHTDARWAAKSAFGERIAHGMLLLSYAVGLLPLDPERVLALRGLERVSFKRPVAIGDTISVSATVEESKPAGDGIELLTLDWRILNQRDQLAARAKAQLLWRSAPDDEAGGEDELNRVNGLPAL